MIARFTTSIGPAVTVTLGLLLLMQFLIASDARPDFDPPRFRIVDYIHVERSPPEVLIDETPAQPPEVADPPTLPPVGTTETTIQVQRAVPARPELPDRFDAIGVFVDADLLPIVTVAPSYPARAAVDDIEGYVVVKFVVTENGSVRDVSIVESTHRVFEGPAIEAAEKFRYRPRVVNGRPVEVHDVRKRITFVLDK